jgi:hypothetical protein
MNRTLHSSGQASRPAAWLILALISLGIAAPAHAIVTAGGGLSELPTGLDLAGVARLDNGCSGVLLQGGEYVLASGHCAEAAGGQVFLGDGTISATVAETVFAPGFSGATAESDLSLSRLSVPVSGVAGYARAPTPSLPTAIVLAGYGLAGSGGSGATVAGGVLRFGRNDYEQLLADDATSTPPAIYNGSVAGFDFDDGSAGLNRFGSLGQGTSEAGLAGGDSGGPSFALLQGQWQIVGIHVAVDDQLGYGFGGVSYDILVGPFAEWIAQVTSVPEPSIAAMWVLGVALLAASSRAGRRTVSAHL